MRSSGNKDAPKLGKKAQKLDEDAINTDGQKVMKALLEVDVRRYIDTYNTLNLEDYLASIHPVLKTLRPCDLDGSESMKDLMISMLSSCAERFPVPPTRDSPQSFFDSINNINKFFGNEIGNRLHKVLNVMCIYYAGKKPIIKF